MHNPQPVPGQRWSSDSEPELGLGVILSLEQRRVEILFPAAQEQRLYARGSSILRRVRFGPGDRIRTHEGLELVVEDVREEEGLLTYIAADREIPESELSDTISFSSPKERLFAGQVDPGRTFELRAEALSRWSAILGSPVRGYVGGRVDLIPHQLSIAVEVCSRLAPRVLLADEVGLGKTIEAGLILHRLHLTGRAKRILIIVPEPLVHQWFVEMLRRFNLTFSILDEKMCASLERVDSDVNPFTQSQLVLCGIDLLTDSRRRAKQVLAAEWDLLVVDEAHHLEWTPQLAGTGYRIVDALANNTPGVLLLTATPQQLGPEGHFARLRLLDPERYSNLEAFRKESDEYERVAALVDRVLNNLLLNADDRALFADRSERITRRFDEYAEGVEGAERRLIDDLLDSFGTGRVMFRNTRGALSGFPERKAHLYPLSQSDPIGEEEAYMEWLTALLKDLGSAKVVLICHSAETSERLHERLQVETRVKSALFHEGLTLIQRDRNAAWFSEPDGVQLLVCSEIGSEGRNFQFAHHLVLFDLPSDPELLEQRIGRLDRIGQTETINIHVPYLTGTRAESLARWYHEGLNAFEENLHGASEIAHALHGELEGLLESFSSEALDLLIRHSREECANVTGKLAHGYDRLLELNSNKPERAEETRRQISAADNDRSFEQFFLRLLEFFGMHIEELSPRTWLFRPDLLMTDQFPPIPREGMAVTFDRTRALSREDQIFITADHPFVQSVMELFLESEHGNATFAEWEEADRDAVILEVRAVAECIAPSALHVERFLPPEPIRVAVDHRLADCSDELPSEGSNFTGGDINALLEMDGMKTNMLPSMLDAAISVAEEKLASLVNAAQEEMSAALDSEIERLDDLGQMNDHVSADEIEKLRERQRDLHEALGTARLRVGGLRLVLAVPA